ncbi:predicted protein [Histoplasma mississippiense (nom. inval.)]|uniref:predicted protein n=1 Tax=Ajellomyces capsulatus (strain NAm1 / WU24) TaxID=2059318 RepID=UPI000157C251|nr:predicted protein [Histoplasma mississippiense (nom. inval.)]EDN07845.1 predicted protein [Histoplasma mississippiense (nom. inval.)]
MPTKWNQVPICIRPRRKIASNLLVKERVLIGTGHHSPFFLKKLVRKGVDQPYLSSWKDPKSTYIEAREVASRPLISADAHI